MSINGYKRSRKFATTYLALVLLIISLSAQTKQPYTSMAEPPGATYRFVVIGDLTGGELPGKFSYAVDRVNELAPDFVMSVGDFIDGYTVNREIILEQWAQFHKVSGRLNAPFYYVPGNHDVGNPVLQDIWNNQYGQSHYTFTIRGDLFIVLNTFESGKEGISQTQTGQIMSVIKTRPAGSRIFVFSHSPLWKGFDSFLSGLTPYKAYYFCGHEHHYIHKTYKGQEHYMLAGVATGDERNVDLGLYHNLLQVTVTPTGVHVANIELEGLLPPSVVDNASEKQVNMFLANRWASIKPAVAPGNTTNVASVLTVSNQSDYPLAVKAMPKAIPGVRLHEVDGITVAPGTVKNVPVGLDILKKTGFDSLPRIGLQLKGIVKQDGKEIASDLFAEWVVDYVRECGSHTNRYIRCVTPATVDESWDWSGNDDGSFEYKVYSDNRFIYIEVKTHDDVLVKPAGDSPVADKVSVYFAPDTALKVAAYAVFDFIPGSKALQGKESTLKIAGAESKCETDGNSIRTFLKIPRKTVKGNGFKVNIAFADADNPINLDPSVIWWKPRWNSRKDYPGAGNFMIMVND